jgi:hypothetical protein
LSRYLSRSSRQIKTVEIFEICRDFSRFVEIYRDISTLSRLFEVLQDQKSRQIEKSQSRNVIKLTNSRSRTRQTVKICQKCHVSTDFSISIVETNFLKLSRFSRPSRLTFFGVEIESLDRDHVETNRDPQP